MRTLAMIIGFGSGFALMGVDRTPVSMIATSLLVDAALAPLTGVIAARGGRSGLVWTMIGLPLGMWALAFALLFLRSRKRAPDDSGQPPFPPTSDAA